MTFWTVLGPNCTLVLQPLPFCSSTLVLQPLPFCNSLVLQPLPLVLQPLLFLQFYFSIAATSCLQFYFSNYHFFLSRLFGILL